MKSLEASNIVLINTFKKYLISKKIRLIEVYQSKSGYYIGCILTNGSYRYLCRRNDSPRAKYSRIRYFASLDVLMKTLMSTGSSDIYALLHLKNFSKTSKE